MNEVTVKPISLDNILSAAVRAPIAELNEFCSAQRASMAPAVLPNNKQEQWKYTDLTFLQQQKYAVTANAAPEFLSPEYFTKKNFSQNLIVFVNGAYAPALSKLTALPAGVIICPLSDALQKYPELVAAVYRDFDQHTDFFAKLNATAISEGLFLSVPKDCVIETPLQLLFLTTNAQSFVTAPRHLIQLGDNSVATLIAEYVTHDANNYFTNVVTDIFLNQNAQLNFYKIQTEASDAMHMASTFVTQHEHAIFKGYFFSTGGAFARDNLTIDQLGNSAIY
jgi:Fe-S cluster assembly protein SufD